MKKAKENWDDLCSQYCAAMGKFVIVAQLVKALNNIKSCCENSHNSYREYKYEGFV